MHRILMLILLLAIPVEAQAQQGRFDCDTGERYTTQVQVLLPAIAPDSFTQYIVTVIGLDEFHPVVGVETADMPASCNIGSELAAQYAATLPEIGEITPSLNSAQNLALTPGQNIVHIGEFSDQPGTLLLLIESTFDPALEDTHSYTLTLTEGMFGGDIAPAAYLFSFTPELAPTLSMTTAEGETIEAAPVEEPMRMQSLVGVAESAVGVTLPESAGDVQLTVGRGGSEGLYLLALLLQTGEALPGDGIAQVTDNEDGSLTLACDGQVVSENGVRFDLPDDGETDTVTALRSATYDPVIATVDDDGAGFCFDNTEAALSYATALPTVTLNSSPFNAQAVVDDAARAVVIGSRDSTSGEFALIIEGGTVEAGDDGDIYGVQITPGMVNAFDVLTTYAISTVNELNVLLAYVDGAGAVISDDSSMPYQCDDAGIPDACYGQTTSLRDYNITLADGVQLLAFELDALLLLPLDSTLTGTIVPLRVTADADTAGGYVVVFHIVTQ